MEADIVEPLLDHFVGAGQVAEGNVVPGEPRGCQSIVTVLTVLHSRV